MDTNAYYIRIAKSHVELPQKQNHALSVTSRLSDQRYSPNFSKFDGSPNYQNKYTFRLHCAFAIPRNNLLVRKKYNKGIMQTIPIEKIYFVMEHCGETIFIDYLMIWRINCCRGASMLPTWGT